MCGMQEEERKKIALTVNGVSHELEVGSESYQVASSHIPAHALRENLGLELIADRQ